MRSYATAAAASVALALASCARADRIELQPARVDFVGAGKTTQVRAMPYASNGRFLPEPPCAWSSSDEQVVRVAAKANEATLTAAGRGSAVVRCTVGGARAELPVQVRVVARLSVKPERLELKVQDERVPQPLAIEAFDDTGRPLVGRAAVVTCASEEVCRGDARGQVWPVGPGVTSARVELEGAAVEIPVKVTEARSADARPKAVQGNPMEEIEREWNKKLEAERKAAEKAAGGK
ncbi:MAG TPA: hypothetical protein VEB43_03300 [Anaeromyxobacter sp.]|nr:hypothetical protein [Anaeromyxobacter sp.]